MLGGVLIEIASWHWIFLINIPFGIIGIILALRWWPETWDLSAVGKQVDVRGMLLLGGAVLFLTMALIEANPFGGDLPLLAQPDAGRDPARRPVLLVGAARARPDDHARPAGEQAVPQREHRDALLRGGAIGSLLLLSLVFVNLWGYTQLEAALAIVPIPLCGLVAWPFVGRAADTRRARASSRSPR